MTLGGIHDQLAGGFHRTASTAWSSPLREDAHDNAQLATTYAPLARLRRDADEPDSLTRVRLTLDYALRDATPGGAFASRTPKSTAWRAPLL